MKVFFVVALLNCTLLLSAQKHYTRHFTSHNGLPSNYVYAAVQDKKGYIWFATDNGVSRFDGKRFRNFSSSQGLPDNDVFKIGEDAGGRMWLSCFSNHCCYIYENRVYTVENDTALKKLISHTYCSLTTFRDKLIINLQLPAPAYQVSADGKTEALATKLPAVVALKDYLLTTSLYGPYLYLLDASYEVLDSMRIPPDLKKPDPFNPLTSVFETGNNSFIMHTTQENNLKYQVKENKLVSMDTLRECESFLTLHHEGNSLWMNRGAAGIWPVNAKLKRDTSEAPLFIGNPVTCFFIDREGNYWGCTLGKGVYMIPNTAMQYQFNDKELRKQPVKIAAAGKEIYVGFDDGSVHELRSGCQHPNLTNPQADISHTKPYCMQSDSSGVLLSRPDGIVTIYQGKSRQDHLPIGNVKWFCKSKDHLLIGDPMGASLLSLPGNVSTLVYQGRTTTVCESSNGDILIGTINGLKRCRKSRAGDWLQEPILPEVLGNTRISCLAELDGVLLVGTVQKGLLLVQDGKYAFAQVDKGPGNINCTRIFMDSRKTIWVATFEGLFQLRLDSGLHRAHLRRISAFNGMLSNIVSDVSVINDTVYAVGPEGITSFPATLFNGEDKGPLPQVYVDEVLTAGGSHPVKNTITLAPDIGYVELHLSGIDFKSLGNIVFRYRMPGLNNSWQTSTNNVVRFESLPPGDYVFEAMVMNSRNTWSERPAVIHITVAPFWWQKTWFRLLVLMLLIVFVSFAARAVLVGKHKRELHDVAMKRHISEVELRAIKAQINPHFIFNILNAVQHFVTSNQNEEAENYISSMARLIRRTLDFSNRVTVTVEEEILYLENYLQLERLRFDENFCFRIVNQLPEHAAQVEIPPMVLQPHVENALRHGLKHRTSGIKKLDIRFRLSGKDLVCEIEDNGIGRKQAAENKGGGSASPSMGTELSKAKLSIYEYLRGKKVNTEITDLYRQGSGEPAGTLIRITINQ